MSESRSSSTSTHQGDLPRTHQSNPLVNALASLTGGVHTPPRTAHLEYDSKHAEYDSKHSSTRATVVATKDTQSSSATGEVSVLSSVKTDTTSADTKPQVAGQIQTLLSRLSTTTSQVDEYSRRAHERISSDAGHRVQAIIAETQQKQDALLQDASSRAHEIESEYSAKLKAFLQELDASKASNLASLEKDLNFRQETLLASAREDIDRINFDATQQKIGVMTAANANVIHDVDELTDRVKRLSEEEMERRISSTTTTVITTQTKAEGHAHTHEKADVTATERSGSATVTTAGAREPRASHVSRP